MFTVQDALNLPAFRDSKVLAGKRQLDNAITAATVLEVTSSEVTTWIKGGELFLTSLYAVANEVDKQKEVLRTLHGQRCAGIAVFSLGYFIDRLDAAVIDLAEELGIPLIVMPPEKGYDEVLEEITMRIHSIQKEELELALHIQSEIFSLLMRKKGRGKIFDFIGTALGKKLAYYESGGRLDYYTGEAPGVPDDIYRFYTGADHPAPPPQRGGDTGGDHILHAVTIQNNYYGTIVVFDVDRREHERIEMVLSNVTLAIISALTKKSVYYPQNFLQRQEFLDKLLKRQYRSMLDIYDRASALGMELYNKHYLVVVELPPDAPSAAFDEVKRVAARDSLSNEVAMLYKQIFIFVNCVEKSISEKRLDALCMGIAAAVECANWPFVGVSGYFHSILDVPDAYREALQALRAGRKFFSGHASMRFDDLGAYAIIFREHATDYVGRYVREGMKRLRQHDEEHGCDYTKTLHILLMDGDNIDAAAEMLHVHKNTLFYRRKKIVQLLGHDPMERNHQLNYQVYFIAQELLEDGS